MQQSISTYLG